MAKKIYALLVGINDYAPEVGKLHGCLNDVDNFHAYLTDNFDKRDLAVEVLKDSEATRDNIIKLFRAHLCKAKSDDVALFQYCGHGARWAADKAFKEFYPDGWDEGFVRYDSRRKDGTFPFDFADKELAVLLSEVAANDPHLAVIMDCCHSGSATRGTEAFMRLKARQTHEVKEERPLDSYLDGYYAKLQQKDAPLFIPASNHILLAACERWQKANETEDCSGVFTSALIEVLDKTGSDISYAELFVRCRAVVRQRVDDQTPQFEPNVNFNAYAGFLGREISKTPRRYSVYFEKKENSWKIDAGVLHGFPSEPEKNVVLALYPEDDQSRMAGKASTTVIGPQKSELHLGFASDRSMRYRAEIISLPVAPFPVYLEGDESGKEILRNALNPSINVDLTDIADGTRYTLTAEKETFLLKQSELDSLIIGVRRFLLHERSLTSQHQAGESMDEIFSAEAAHLMLSFAKQVVQWERGLALQNHRTQMDASLVDFLFTEALDDGQEFVFPAGEIVLDFAKSGNEWNAIRGKFKVRNRTQQTLHFTLAYFSPAYGVYILRNEPIVPSTEYVTLWGDEPNDYFWLEEGNNESIENFKLLVSTEKVDDFLLSQDDLKIGEIISGIRNLEGIKPAKKLVHENEWFTKHLRVKIVRQLDQLSVKDIALAQGKIIVKGHPSVRANLSLCAAKTLSRSLHGGFDFYKALERHGMEMLNFSNTPSDYKNILELTDVKNTEALQENPLEIVLNVPIKDDEEILPLTFDGQNILRVGNAYKDEDGHTRISIDHIPAAPDNRRSLGKTLKLYFFKTAETVNTRFLSNQAFQPEI
jgi:hypothetical protein